MVEHSAVNRVVAGSSPARGARAKEESGAAVPKLKRIRLRGQAVKTSPFHGGNTGSIPVGVIWRRSQVVRQWSATPVSTGSNPVCASFIQKIFFWFFLFEIGFIITCIILQKSLYCQSTLSKSIRALEDEYKVILINRGAKKFDVTSVDK